LLVELLVRSLWLDEEGEGEMDSDEECVDLVEDNEDEYDNTEGLFFI
jgi:hypothetical protein